jgi:hypothetical protein
MLFNLGVILFKKIHRIFELDQKVIFQNQESQRCTLGFVYSLVWWIWWIVYIVANAFITMVSITTPTILIITSTMVLIVYQQTYPLPKLSMSTTLRFMFTTLPCNHIQKIKKYIYIEGVKNSNIF